MWDWHRGWAKAGSPRYFSGPAIKTCPEHPITVVGPEECPLCQMLCQEREGSKADPVPALQELSSSLPPPQYKALAWPQGTPPSMLRPEPPHQTPSPPLGWEEKTLSRGLNDRSQSIPFFYSRKSQLILLPRALTFCRASSVAPCCVHGAWEAREQSEGV